MTNKLDLSAKYMISLKVYTIASTSKYIRLSGRKYIQSRRHQSVYVCPVESIYNRVDIKVYTFARLKVYTIASTHKKSLEPYVHSSRPENWRQTGC